MNSTGTGALGGAIIGGAVGARSGATAVAALGNYVNGTNPLSPIAYGTARATVGGLFGGVLGAAEGALAGAVTFVLFGGSHSD